MKTVHYIRIPLLAAALFLGGCLFEEDKEDKTPEPTPGAELTVSYATAVQCTVGAAILPLVPAITVDTTNPDIGPNPDAWTLRFSVSPALPDGLTLDQSSGVISGTPAAVSDSATYVIRLVFAGDTARDTVVFAVFAAPIPPTPSVAGWAGKPLDSLMEAGPVLFLNGRLLVGNRSFAAPGVAVIDTATGLVTGYYAETIAPASMAATADGRIVITETDYTQGAVSVFDPAAPHMDKSVISFGSDNGAVSAGGRVYLFNRTTGAVTGFTGNVPGQNVTLDVQAGAGSNPYEIAVADGKAYIARYNSKSLLILGDVNAIGGGTRDSIDLGAYVSRTPLDTPATAPRMSSVIAHNGYLFVTLQRLNYSYSALDTSLVVVINAATKAIEKVIPLRFRNPVSTVVLDGKLYVAGIAGYGDLAGGVEAIDLNTRLHAGVIVTEATLGADVFGFVPAGNGNGYVSYSTDFGFHTKVKKISSVSTAKIAAR